MLTRSGHHPGRSDVACAPATTAARTPFKRRLASRLASASILVDDVVAAAYCGPMRNLMIVAVFAGLCAGFSHTALANYFYPGTVIVGWGGWGGWGGGGGGGGSGGTTSTMEECVLSEPIQCECFPGMKLLDACELGGTNIKCLTADMVYVDVKQAEPVLIIGPQHTLGYLTCSEAETKMTAYVEMGGPVKQP
jgi:hypothetical protein